MKIEHHNIQAGRQQPATSYQLPATSYQLPTTSYQLPTTSYQLPATSYQLPATSYQLPATSKGFTLIETLVAMMILAISLTVILQLFSGGLKASRLSDEYSRALFHAREKMEEILLVDELANGISRGEFDDGFKWYAEIFYLVLEDEAEENETKKMPVDMFRITVKIGWQEGEKEKEFEIRTLKIGTLIAVEERKDNELDKNYAVP